VTETAAVRPVPAPAVPREATPTREVPPLRVTPPSREATPPRDVPPPTRLAAPVEPAPARVARPETALPFEAVLGTILYSPDRKLAIVDGRIVGVGDEVRGAYVSDITPTAVFLRDAQGRLRRLAMSGAR
jgi:hypothetical protein